MRISDIEKKARSLGIKDTWKFSKKDLVRLIQRNEGNFDCYGTAVLKMCDQNGCYWRVDCLK